MQCSPVQGISTRGRRRGLGRKGSALTDLKAQTKTSFFAGAQREDERSLLLLVVERDCGTEREQGARNRSKFPLWTVARALLIRPAAIAPGRRCEGNTSHSTVFSLPCASRRPLLQQERSSIDSAVAAAISNANLRLSAPERA